MNSGLHDELILNPTFTYSDDFRRVLEVLHETRSRRVLQKRQLVFFLKPFTTQYSLHYGFDQPNLITYGEFSNFQYSKIIIILLLHALLLN